MQPGAGKAPFLVHGARGQVEGRGGFINGQAGEVTQHDDFGFRRVEFFQLGERLVQCEELGGVGVVRGGGMAVAEGHGVGRRAAAGGGWRRPPRRCAGCPCRVGATRPARCPRPIGIRQPRAAPLQAPSLTCVIDADAAHGFCGGSEKMSAAVPADVIVADEAEVGFVDEDGGLEGVVGLLGAELAVGDLAEFVIDEGPETLGGAGCAGVDGGEELRDRFWS